MTNILIFGASTTYGRWDNKGAGWAGRLRKYIDTINEEKDTDHVVYNLGISGDDTGGVLKRFKTEAQPRCWGGDINLVIFALGINDSIINSDGAQRTEIKDFKKNLHTLTDQAKKLTNKIIYIGLTSVIEEKVSPMPWSPTESYSNKSIEEYDAIIRNVCKNYKVRYLDLFKYTNKQKFSKYLDDGVHPNSEGHQKIFEIVRDFLIKEKLI